MSAARQIASALLLAAALAAPAAAQLPSASAPALGMGENYTAVARGFNAIAWNPAMLGLAGGPLSSFTVLSVRGDAGLDPVSAGDLAAFEGRAVPSSVREEWLSRIAGDGSESGSAGTELTLMAASALRFGVQVSTQIRGTADMGPGGAQLLLFGNAGRTGQAENVSLEGSSFNVAATTTVAVGYAQPIFQHRDGSGLALGATVKYTLGNAFATGMDVGSEVSAEPLAVDLRFPIVQTDTIVDIAHLNNGGGWGLDLGVAWQGPRWVAGVTMKNVVDTFEWDRSKLFYRTGVASIAPDSTVSDFNARAFDGAPQALKQRVDDLGFQPSLAAGLAFRPTDKLRLSADVHHSFEESALGDPTNHVGLGAELRPLVWHPLRAGAAKITGGQLLSGGMGLEVGAIAINASVASRTSSLGTDAMGMFTFTAGMGRP
jgi:hypothetical protein